MARKNGLESGVNPPTAIFENGQFRQGNGRPFRGLTFPLDVVSYEAGSFDVVKD